MNCGIFTSLGLILLALLAFFGLAGQEAVMVEPLLGESQEPAPSVIEVVPTPQELLCDLYPAFCLPLVGGGDGVFAQSELAFAPNMTVTETEPGVVRGISADGSYFIGNPDAPIRFKVFHNFGCGHCRTFHNGDFGLFIESHVVTGQAVLEVDLMAFGSPPYPTEAAYAAMCAGEQGAFWEMQAILFERPAFATLDEMVGMAEALGLQGAALHECVKSDRYAAALDVHNLLAYDLGVNATPTVLVSYGDGEWEPVNRSYDNLVALTEVATGQ